MEKKRQHDFIVKLCCIFASFCLWLYIYNVVSPVKSYKLHNVPVELVNMDSLAGSKLAIEPNQKFYVTLSLSGSASDVYTVTPDKFKIVADLSKYVLRQGECKIPVEILQYPQNVNIVNDNTLFLTVKFDQLVEKSVPIKINKTGSPKIGYFSFEPESKLNYVIVSGAESVVKYVSYATGEINITGMDKDANMELPLKATDDKGNILSNVTISPKNLEIDLPIKKKKSVPVIIKLKGNVPNPLIKSIAASPSQVDIAGDEGILNNVNSINTEDIDASKVSTTKNIEVNLVLPSDIKLVNGSGRVLISITADSVVKRDFTVPIKPINLSNELTTDIDTQNVTVTLSGMEATMNTVKTEDIIANIDLNLLSEGEHTVPVNINIPSKISKVSINPENIKVIIKKK